MARIKLQKLTIENVCGIEEFSVEPGRLTVLRGGNGKGKTSVLKALRTIIGGGSEATIRRGEEEARAVLLLSDGTEVTATSSGNGWRKRVVPPGSDGKKKPLSKPQAFLDSIHDSLSFNPLDFAKERTGARERSQRIEWLLEMLPISLDEAAIDAAEQGIPVDAADTVPGRPALTGAEALAEIERRRAAAYDARTGVNRLAREKRSTADESYRSVPKEPEAAPDLDQLRADLAELRGDQQRQLAAVAADTREAVAEATHTCDDSVRVIREALDLQIRALRDAADAEIKRADETKRLIVEAAQADSQRRTEAIRGELTPLIDSTAADLAAAEATLELHAGQAKIREMARRADEEAGKLERESGTLTAAIDRLDALRAGLLESLPVAGLEVRAGELYLDGLPFDEINTARRIMVAMEIGAARIGPDGLALMAFDGLEALDNETFEEFVRYLDGRPDLQVFGAAVDAKAGALVAEMVR